MRRLFLLFLPAVLAAQTITQSATVTSATPGSDVSNIGNTPAIGWRLDFWFTGSITAGTMQLECAADNGSGSPSSYSACSGAVDGTTNPVTISAAPYSGTIALKYYTPHIRINPTSLTGSGTVHWNLTGLFGSTTAPTTVSTSGGGGGSTVIETACDPANGGASVNVALSGTAYTQIVAASGTTKISVCNIAVTSASSGTPNVNTFTVAFGSCSGSPTQALGPLAGITGYTDNFFGTLQGAAGGALCMKESVANSDVVTVSYLQK